MMGTMVSANNFLNVVHMMLLSPHRRGVVWINRVRIISAIADRLAEECCQGDKRAAKRCVRKRGRTQRLEERGGGRYVRGREVRRLCNIPEREMLHLLEKVFPPLM